MRPRVSLERKLAELKVLDLDALRAQYRSAFGEAPPSDASTALLSRAIGFRLQSRLIARLRSKMMQALTAAEIVGTLLSIDSANTLLLGEWCGRLYEVEVADDGIFYGGEQFGSLAEVARAITGSDIGTGFFLAARGAEIGVAANGPR